VVQAVIRLLEQIEKDPHRSGGLELCLDQNPPAAAYR
jgi:hypothetical protein